MSEPRDRLAALLPHCWIVEPQVSSPGAPITWHVVAYLPEQEAAALADRLEQAERDKAAVERAILVREQLRKRFRDCPEDQILLIAAICNDLADALRTTEADR